MARHNMVSGSKTGCTDGWLGVRLWCCGAVVLLQRRGRAGMRGQACCTANRATPIVGKSTLTWRLINWVKPESQVGALLECLEPLATTLLLTDLANGGMVWPFAALSCPTPAPHAAQGVHVHTRRADEPAGASVPGPLKPVCCVGGAAASFCVSGVPCATLGPCTRARTLRG